MLERTTLLYGNSSLVWKKIQNLKEFKRVQYNAEEQTQKIKSTRSQRQKQNYSFI